MNTSKLPLKDQAAVTQDLRRDGKSRELVNRAISIQQEASTLCALEYLKSHAIPGPVIERVLMGPDRRRIPTLS